MGVSELKAVAALLCVAALGSPAWAEPAPACLAAAHRIFGFLKQEARGTRHEAQIAATVREKGEGRAVADLAATLDPNQCAFMITAPDSTLRALAIASLPERNGQ